MTQATSTWVILGATAGAARDFIRQRAVGGAGLCLVARDEAELDAMASDLRLRGAAAVSVVAGDVSSLDVQARVLEQAATLGGKLNLFSAVGIMPTQEDMLKDPALLQTQMDANSTAIMQMVNRLLPIFEDQQAGMIVLLGSVAGDRGRKKNFIYGASKAALAAYTQGLAAHLSAFNVPVLLVKPGVLDTAMTWGLKNPPVPLGTPEGLARAVQRRIAAHKGGVLYYPWFWWGIMTLIRHLPTTIFNKLNF